MYHERVLSVGVFHGIDGAADNIDLALWIWTMSLISLGVIVIKEALAIYFEEPILVATAEAEAAAIPDLLVRVSLPRCWTPSSGTMI